MKYAGVILFAANFAACAMAEDSLQEMFDSAASSPEKTLELEAKRYFLDSPIKLGPRHSGLKVAGKSGAAISSLKKNRKLGGGRKILESKNSRRRFRIVDFCKRAQGIYRNHPKRRRKILRFPRDEPEARRQPQDFHSPLRRHCGAQKSFKRRTEKRIFSNLPRVDRQPRNDIRHPPNARRQDVRRDVCYSAFAAHIRRLLFNAAL